MHSIIFQVSKTPIKKDDHTSACDYEDSWFTRTIADYVSDNCDRLGCLECLMYHGLSVDKIGDDDVAMLLSKEEFFEQAYSKFTEAVNKINDMTLTEFCSSKSADDIWSVNDAYGDKYGLYIDFDDELMTLFEWVRLAETNVPYYIGGTIDYRF